MPIDMLYCVKVPSSQLNLPLNPQRSCRNEDLVRAVAHFAAAHSERLPAFVNMHLPARGALPRTVR